MRKAIIIGASQGIGRALALEFSQHGYSVGLASRNLSALDALSSELNTPAFVKQLDVTEPSAATTHLRALIDEMDGVDVIVVNSGVLFAQPTWDEVAATIDVNVTGFAAMAEVAMTYFSEKGCGHIVGISSIAGVRGARRSSVYNASKAFEVNYLQGLRHRAAHARVPIHITDIRPGPVRTEMIAKLKSMFWVVSPEAAARDIFKAIEKKKKCAYVPRRWWPMSWIIKAVPDWLYRRA